MATHALVEITPATMDALASRVEVKRALPFLFEGIARAKADEARSCCGRRAAAREATRVAYDNALKAVVALSPENRRVLKSFLDADKLRVTAGTTHDGTIVRHTL